VVGIERECAGLETELVGGGEDPASQERSHSPAQMGENHDDVHEVWVFVGDVVHNVAGLDDTVSTVKDVQKEIKKEDQAGAEGIFFDEEPQESDDNHSDMGDAEDGAVAVAVGESSPEAKGKEGAEADHGVSGDDVGFTIAKVFEHFHFEGFCDTGTNGVKNDVENEHDMREIGEKITEGSQETDGRIVGGFSGSFGHGQDCERANQVAEEADTDDDAEFPPGGIFSEEPCGEEHDGEPGGLPGGAEISKEATDHAGGNNILKEGKPTGKAHGEAGVSKKAAKEDQAEAEFFAEPVYEPGEEDQRDNKNKAGGVSPEDDFAFAEEVDGFHGKDTQSEGPEEETVEDPEINRILGEFQGGEVHDGAGEAVGANDGADCGNKGEEDTSFSKMMGDFPRPGLLGIPSVCVFWLLIHTVSGFLK